DWVFQDRGMYGTNDLEDLAAALKKSGRATFGVYLRRTAAPPRQAEGRWAAEARRFDTRDDAMSAAFVLLAWDVRVFVLPVDAAPPAKGTSRLVGGRPWPAEPDPVPQPLPGAGGRPGGAAPPEGPAAPPPPDPLRRELPPAEMAEEVTAS